MKPSTSLWPATLVGLTLLALIPATPRAEEIYRWVDASGTVHYSQVAPQGIASERVTPGNRFAHSEGTLSNPRTAQPPAAPAAGAAAPAPESGQPQLTDAQQKMQQQLDQQEAERLADVRKTRQANCEAARKQFKEFTTYARIRVDDGSGDVRILGEDERQKRIDEAKKAIVLNCDDSGAG